MSTRDNIIEAITIVVIMLVVGSGLCWFLGGFEPTEPENNFRCMVGVDNDKYVKTAAACENYCEEIGLKYGGTDYRFDSGKCEKKIIEPDLYKIRKTCTVCNDVCEGIELYKIGDMNRFDSNCCETKNYDIKVSHGFVKNGAVEYYINSNETIRRHENGLYEPKNETLECTLIEKTLLENEEK